MNVSNPPIMELPSASSAAKSKNNKLTTAIKAYKDEYFTGLTDEEREEIKKKLKAYLLEHPIKNDADRNLYTQYYKNLLKEYGYKGNPDELIADLTGEIQSEAADASAASDTSKISDASFAYRESICNTTFSRERVLTSPSKLEAEK